MSRAPLAVEEGEEDEVFFVFSSPSPNNEVWGRFVDEEEGRGGEEGLAWKEGAEEGLEGREGAEEASPFSFSFFS